MAESQNKHNALNVSKLKASDVPEWDKRIKVESEGIVFSVWYKPNVRLYVANAPSGDRYEESSLASLKSALKSYAAPDEHSVVTVEGKTVGHIMIQDNEFFYRPVGTKVIGEKLYRPQDVRESLIKQGMKLD
ncbi:hypothetical protein [Pseudomonas serbica]|jgi:hypothetical protein|uniref:hypothetical protein n=1 Tax=Pseudomonas serbica TaxID=2965074 RepID=UPI00237AFE54|nr:hypothetical protein [Pseudomonas serbica]